MPRDGLRAQVTFAMVPAWVLERCSSQAVHVYALLMRRANRERRAWPKTETIAEQMGKSLRTVERAIAELRRVGALETRRRHGANGWVLGLDFTLIQVDPQAEGHPANSGGMALRHPATSVAAIPPPVSGQEREPVNEIQEQREQTALPAEHPVEGQVFGRPVLDPANPCEAFLLAWNDSIRPPLKPVTTLTPKRKALIRARLRERPLDEWRAVIVRIAASEFCRGAKGWMASLQWLIAGPDPAVNALEGQYDDRRSTTALSSDRPQFQRTECPHEPSCPPGTTAYTCSLRTTLGAKVLGPDFEKTIAEGRAQRAAAAS